MTSIGSVVLTFDPQLNKLPKSKELQDGLSVVAQIGDTLWVTNDETISLERLSRQPDRDGELRYGDHKQFKLNNYLRLPVPPPSDPKEIEEADIEGLDYDRKSGYLWLVGSHSLKRRKVDEDDKDDPVDKNIDRLAKVSSDGNRFLLARIPLMEKDGTIILEKEVTRDGKKLRAAQLRGDHQGNDLTEALAQDKHLQPFLKIPNSLKIPGEDNESPLSLPGIPGKDNGFDIEGLAVAGERLFIGLRGPVLRGWAVILEVELKEDNDDPSTLKLKKIGPDERSYRKHFLQLGGLGIRDLCVQGPDLLILAGPTMELDGPVTVFRWRQGAQPNEESMVFDPSIVLDVPFGEGENKGKDHAEGMALFSPDGGGSSSILVVYDSASKDRQFETRPEESEESSSVKADIFALSEATG